MVTLSPVFPGVQNPSLKIKPGDFHAPRVYQDFTVDGVVPEGTFGVYAVNFDPAPNRSLCWDYAKYELLKPYSDQRIIEEWYPEFQPAVNFTRAKGDEPLRAHVIYGSAYQSSGVRTALQLLGKHLRRCSRSRAISAAIRPRRRASPTNGARRCSSTTGR